MTATVSLNVNPRFTYWSTIAATATLLAVFPLFNYIISLVLFKGDIISPPGSISSAAGNIQSTLESLSTLSFAIFAVFGFLFFSDSVALKIKGWTGIFFTAAFLLFQVFFLIINYRLEIRLSELVHSQATSISGIISGMNWSALSLYFAFVCFLMTSLESIRLEEN